MGNKTFEEQFSELKYKGRCHAKKSCEFGTCECNLFTEEDIETSCLSRQRVKEAIESFENNLLETGIQSKESRVILTRKFDILKDKLGIEIKNE